jgi:methylamine utilization protein MauE
MELIGPYLAACMLLVVAGGAKAARPGDTARAVAVTMRRRPGQVQPIVRSAAAGEAILGIAAMARPSPITASLVAASYLGFAVFVGVALARGGPLASCGCFGTPDTPATRTHVVVDLVLAASAVAVASTMPTQWFPRLLAGQPWSGVPLVVLSLLCAWLAFLAMTRLAELGAVRRTLGIVRGGTT